MTLTQITNRAKQIRKKHPSKKWTDCIKQASRELKTVKAAPVKKVAKKKSAVKKVVRKKRRVGAVKKPAYRQTGSSVKAYDSRLKAKAPGKRIVKHPGKKSTVYYERRKNRSDKPGTVNGIGDLMQLVKLSKGNFERLQKELKEAAAKHKASKDRFTKMIYKTRMDRLKYEIRERKTVLASLASQLKAVSKKK